MFVYAPIEYHMLLGYIDNYKKTSKKSPIILTAHIELIALHTGNPVFKTTTFRKAIIKYKKYGVYQPEKAQWTMREALHYARHTGMIHKQMKECEKILF